MLRKCLILLFITLPFQFKCYGKNVFLHVNENKERDYFFLSNSDEKTWSEILGKVKEKSWFEAFKLEKKIENTGFRNAINTYITFKKFENIDNFSPQEAKGLIEFNTENSFLFSFNDFNKIIENLYLNEILKYESVEKYFDNFSSKNIALNIKLFKNQEEYLKNMEKDENELNKKIKELNRKINNFWIYKDLNEEEELIFYQNFSDRIHDSSTVLKMKLLTFKKRDFSRGLKYLKNEDYQQFFKIISNINTATGNLDKLLKDMPKQLTKDETLLFAKVLYFRRIKEHDKAVEILLNLREEEIFAGYWWLYRHIYARNLLGEKKYKQAYTISSGFTGKKGSDYAESQWLSGWIAFNYLKQNAVALKHFKNFYSYVAFPTSIADGAYWIAKIYESSSMKKDALKWFDISAKYSTTFYGQLSHYAKYNILATDGEPYQEIVFPKPQEATEEEKNSLNNNRVVKLGILYLRYLNERDNGFDILRYSIQKHLKKRGEIAELIEILETFNDETLIIPLAKFASHRLVFFLNHLFPKLRSIKKDGEEISLIHAIIKQESGFVIKAESPVGALGFMQIMPATAKQLSKELKITYSQYKLQHDPQYNMVLGKYYIKSLLKQYRDSKVLAIAAYNAGPNSCNRWINDYGDPRENNSVEGVVNWIESIPYKETRNYVKRVLENLIVYEYVIQ